jgi:hypothetical protein
MKPWRGESGWLGSEPKALGGRGALRMMRRAYRGSSVRSAGTFRCCQGLLMNRRPALGCARASQGFLSSAYPKGMSGA